MSDVGKVLVVGMGYVGEALTVALSAQNISWFALRRRPHPDPRVFPIDLDTDSIDATLLQVDTIVYLAPPSGREPGDPTLRRFLRMLERRPPRRIIYASTTGVYGNQNGAWVDENSMLRAGSPRALRRLDAEEALVDQAERLGSEWVIIRLPGIYGPTRLREDAIRAGLIVPCPEICPPGNRIHRDDIVSAILLLSRSGAPAGVFNLADSEHMTSTDFVRLVAGKLGVELPSCEPDLERYYATHPGMASFLREQRRIDSSRIRQALGWKPRYDDAESGVTASLQHLSSTSR
jgi:nucleoside-diphosphate-sugar epimerase